MRGNLLHKLLERLYRNEECRQGLCAIPGARLAELYAGLIDGVLDECLPRSGAFLQRLRELERELAFRSRGERECVAARREPQRHWLQWASSQLSPTPESISNGTRSSAAAAMRGA